MLNDERRKRCSLNSAFIIQHSSFPFRPRGAAWSARLPVTQDDHPSGGALGSNPVEGAFDKHGAVRKSAKRPSSNLGDVRVRVPPAPLENMRRLGIGEPNCL